MHVITVAVDRKQHREANQEAQDYRGKRRHFREGHVGVELLCEFFVVRVFGGEFFVHDEVEEQRKQEMEAKRDQEKKSRVKTWTRKIRT